jgi:hypothetical protein
MTWKDSCARRGNVQNGYLPQGWLKIVWILSTRGVFLEIVHASEMQKLWFIESCCCGYSILWYVMRVQRLQVSVSSLRTLGPIADNHHHMLAFLWSQRDTHFLTPRQINNISMNMLHVWCFSSSYRESLELGPVMIQSKFSIINIIKVYTVYYKVINVSITVSP